MIGNVFASDLIQATRQAQMSRKSSPSPRPSEIVLDELGADRDTWDLEQHLNGCLAGYQANSSYGTAVYFALEALWGISNDVGVHAKSGRLDQYQPDPEWIIDPKTTLPVPWMWIRALGTAWQRYQTKGGTLGQAFGLEGGQGKPPISDKLGQMLDERAIARWISSRVQEAKTAEKKIRIEDIVQEAVGKFGKSDVTIRRAWQRFGRRERQRQSKK
jgi:hypothetical protein